MIKMIDFIDVLILNDDISRTDENLMCSFQY